MTQLLSPTESLKEAVQLTSAKWAVIIARDSKRDWNLQVAYGLNKKRQSEVRNYLNLEPVTNWISKSLVEERQRSRRVPKDLSFGAARLFIFPLANSERAILVGGDKLTQKEKRIWKLLTRAQILSEATDNTNLQLQPADAFIFGGQTGVPYDLSSSLSRVLSQIVAYIPCKAAWLGIFEEASLKVEAQWRFPDIREREIIVKENVILQKIIRNGDAALLDSTRSDWEDITKEISPQEAELDF